MAVSEVDVTNRDLQQFRDEGYFVLESAVPSESLEGLREECDMAVEQKDAEMIKNGQSPNKYTQLGKRYSISRRYATRPVILRYIFNDMNASIAQRVLGDTVYMAFELFVVKGPEVGIQLGWHQDSGYLGFPHKPYLNVWVALDDMSEENGTLYVLPFSRYPASREIIPHRPVEEGAHEKIGYTGDDPGDPMTVPAGSIVVITSRVFHRSGTNTSSRPRRAFSSQYAVEPVVKPDVELWMEAVPFIQKGKRVRVA